MYCYIKWSNEIGMKDGSNESCHQFLQKKILSMSLTLNLPSFSNEMNNPPSIFWYCPFSFSGNQGENLKLVRHCIEPGQTAQVCRLAWLYWWQRHHFWFWQVKG